MSQIFEFQDTSTFGNTIIDRIVASYSARSENTQFRIGMSGGSVLWVLESFREKIWHTDKIEIYQIDERFVPEDHPDSNARAIREKIAGSNMQFFPFPVLDTPEKSAEAYTKLLEDITLDVSIIGCGPDGHTASIFPHDPHMDTDDITYSTTTEVFAVKDRMTMSFFFIKRSTHIFLLLEWAKKREIFEKITDPLSDYREYPARKVLDMNQASIFGVFS